MKQYIVGGAVRDRLLGLPVQDRDYVVVGASPEDMLAAGFTPVGKDFPVFLHPRTHEEYALARTERKSAPGYKGFQFHTAPDVTLEQDLIRRDLTINAIAEADDGSLIDPYGGQADLAARIFRHVGPAFVEDPVRILRLARFAARLPAFSIAPETLQLMREMVANGEVDALVPERVWQEISRGLMENTPARMLAVFADCGALARILPGLTLTPDMLAALNRSAVLCAPLEVRFAIMTLALSDAGSIDGFCEALRVPADCAACARLYLRERQIISRAPELVAEEMVALFERCDAYRRPQRFVLVLQACTISEQPEWSAYLPAETLARALQAASGINAGQVAAGCAGRPADIPAAIRAARIEAVRQLAPVPPAAAK